MKPQREWYMLAWSVQIAGPAFLIGILFLANWFKKNDPKINWFEITGEQRHGLVF